MKYQPASPKSVNKGVFVTSSVRPRPQIHWWVDVGMLLVGKSSLEEMIYFEEECEEIDFGINFLENKSLNWGKILPWMWCQTFLISLIWQKSGFGGPPLSGGLDMNSSCDVFTHLMVTSLQKHQSREQTRLPGVGTAQWRAARRSRDPTAAWRGRAALPPRPGHIANPNPPSCPPSTPSSAAKNSLFNQ